jgi:glucose/mannose-6-phosphate isomerase
MTEELFRKFDTENMRKLMLDFPDQWNEIVALTEDLNFSVNKADIQNICLAGMGGSAIGATISAAYAAESSPFPMQVVRHYEIPNWVSKHTLFIACSYSGNTEETVSALEQAIEQGAQIIGVTSGGRVKELSVEHQFDCIQIPGGLPPRAALGYSFVPLFRILRYFDLIDEGEEVLDETHHMLMANVQEYSKLEGNEALDIAHKLKDTLPVIYSDSKLLEAVNIRWRGQLEENAKMLTYGNVFPEMNHNEIIGWEYTPHLKDLLSVVFLTYRDDYRRVSFRIEVFKVLVESDAKSISILETHFRR